MPLGTQSKREAERGPALGRRYEKWAWGMDELMPMAQMGKNSFADMGATLLDGLSTLW